MGWFSSLTFFFFVISFFFEFWFGVWEIWLVSVKILTSGVSDFNSLFYYDTFLFFNWEAFLKLFSFREGRKVQSLVSYSYFFLLSFSSIFLCLIESRINKSSSLNILYLEMSLGFILLSPVKVSVFAEKNCATFSTFLSRWFSASLFVLAEVSNLCSSTSGYWILAGLDSLIE